MSMQSMDIARSSIINSHSPTTFTFTLNQIPPLPASSKIIITFPQILKLTSASTSTCVDLDGTSLTCSYSTIGGSHVLEVTLPATPITSLSQFGISVG